MPILPLVLLIFIGIPLIEIYLLIEVGAVIGAFPTVLAVILTAVIGVSLIRIQGLSTLQKAQVSMNQGQLPANEMFQGLLLLLAAVCLLIPGFFTDAIGFLLLIPPLRAGLAQQIIKNAMLNGRFHGQQNYTFDGDYEHVTPEQQHLHKQHKERYNVIIEGEVESKKDKE